MFLGQSHFLTPTKLFTSILAFVFLAFGSAQDLSQEEILANLEARAESLVDATFLLTGMLIDGDGTEYALEIEVQVMPDQNIARADFFQPDALADNFILIDDDKLYNYIFLTNQATLLNASDPDALGGLFASSEGEDTIDFSLNIETIFDGWDLNVRGYEDSPEGNVYLLEFNNIDESAIINRVEARMLDELWIPYTLLFFNSSDTLIAELVFNDFVADSGLDADDIRYLPDDVEVIDER